MSDSVFQSTPQTRSTTGSPRSSFLSWFLEIKDYVVLSRGENADLPPHPLILDYTMIITCQVCGQITHTRDGFPNLIQDHDQTYKKSLSEIVH